jgi:two-component system nitrogen regulation sensor histidine kinase NtrY
MASERLARRRRRSAVRRAWLYCFFLALPSLVPAVFLLYERHITLAPALLLGGSLLLYLVLVAAALIESMIRPLQTLSNVVSSLREGDYSFRARGAVRLLGLTHARSFGHSARELGLEALLAAPDQSIHSFGTKPTRWLLRKAVFRQDGRPHTLLLLADVSVPLQDEEQGAWKRLIRVLGHELSNSLAPIKSIAGSLLARVDQLGSIDRDAATLHDFRRGLGVVESRADALHRFVQSYRLLAQLPPPHRKPVPIAALLERVVLLKRGNLSDPRLTIQLDPGPPVVLDADPDQLEQMFINLLANAVDASLANGAQPIRAGWHIADSSLLVTIEDRGLGIANIENLFVPFYTTKPAGSGVGLALAQQIARAHGGEISLLNREDGEGARATVRLPLAYL